MSMLEVTPNSLAGINEAPLQLKANCGTLLIDDFGRQRMSVDEVLNRWIVPLEKRYDFLNLSNGRKIQVPVDELIIFATNLELAEIIAKSQNKKLNYEMLDFHSSRPGHDLRYSLSGEKMKSMGWSPKIKVQNRIKQVVEWSLNNPSWIEL